jgi:hypothetical protein
VEGGDGDCHIRHEPVTDFLPDTPSVARAYCPVCEPEADPSVEILDVRWCSSHTPASGGVDDESVTVDAYLSGGVEAGGDDNRRWCELLHRRASEGSATKTAAGRRLRRVPAIARG